jgi:AcrR family transcriptional regulator
LEPALSGAGPVSRVAQDRQRILDTAAALFYAEGVRGVSLDEVAVACGLPAGTVAEQFASKDDLVLAWLGRADIVWQGKLRDAAAAAGDSPRDQMVGLFDALSQACARDGYRGCSFINTAAESAAGTAVHGATVAHKRSVRAWVTGLARQAGATDPAALALMLTTLLDGALAVTALEPRPDVVVETGRAARTLVDAACPMIPSQREGNDYD